MRQETWQKIKKKEIKEIWGDTEKFSVQPIS